MNSAGHTITDGRKIARGKVIAVLASAVWMLDTLRNYNGIPLAPFPKPLRCNCTCSGESGGGGGGWGGGGGGGGGEAVLDLTVIIIFGGGGWKHLSVTRVEVCHVLFIALDKGASRHQRS